MSIQKWLAGNAEHLGGKTVAVTGSTGGLGKELCRYLAELGADLILLDRNMDRSMAHKAALLQVRAQAKIECLPLDLSDIRSVCAATKELQQRPVDLFIHNAGAYKIPRGMCNGGYDSIFQINFASPYYMIRTLLPHLQSRGGRVVAVGSVAHTYSHIDEKDVDFATREACSKAYGNAKRYLMFGLHELMKTHGGVPLAIVHPGITVTGITTHYPKPIYAIIKYPMKVIFMKPKKAALSLLRGVFEDTAYCEWIGPRFFDVWGYPRKRLLTSCDANERQSIARICDEVYRQTEISLVK